MGFEKEIQKSIQIIKDNFQDGNQAKRFRISLISATVEPKIKKMLQWLMDGGDTRYKVVGFDSRIVKYLKYEEDKQEESK